MKILTVLYLGTAVYFFLKWFVAFKRETDLSLQQKQRSVKLIIVATIFWPLVVPISLLEKRSKKYPFSQVGGVKALRFKAREVSAAR